MRGFRQCSPSSTTVVPARTSQAPALLSSESVPAPEARPEPSRPPGSLRAPQKPHRHSRLELPPQPLAGRPRQPGDTARDLSPARSAGLPDADPGALPCVPTCPTAPGPGLASQLATLRARVLEDGPSLLSTAELLTVLGASPSPAIAEGRIREALGDLFGLACRSPLDLERSGWSRREALAFASAIEIARRIARLRLRRRPLTHRPSLAAYLALRYWRQGQEVMGALFLDTRGRLLADRALYHGTLDRAAVEPREFLRQALALQASGLVAFHTHPSGDPTPSTEDLLFTDRLGAAAEIMGVRLLTHLIVGGPADWTDLCPIPWRRAGRGPTPGQAVAAGTPGEERHHA